MYRLALFLLHWNEEWFYELCALSSKGIVWVPFGSGIHKWGKESARRLHDIVFEATREWEPYADAASMRVSEAFSDSNDKVRELRNMQREVAWQNRG